MRFRSAILLASLASLPLSMLAEEKTGAEVYETVCSECHSTGKHDAPVFGDRKRWGKLDDLRIGNRIATPEDVTHVRWHVPANQAARGAGEITYSAIVR